MVIINAIMGLKGGKAEAQLGISRGKVYFRTTDDMRRAIKI